jgi:hypothetical protein
MVVAFILLWVLLGLGVFFVAMRGGPRGARESLHTDSKVGQRSVMLLVVVLFVFGLVIPVIVLVHNGRHRASVAVGGLHLTADQVKGRELFSHSCTACHTLAAVKSVGRIGPNLDVLVGHQITTPAARKTFVLKTILEGPALGLGNMPAELYVGKEAEDVAEFVAAVAGK